MDKETEIAFDVILHAGNGKSAAMAAMDKAESNDIEEANKLLEEAEKETNEAHLIHKKLLDRIVNGESIQMNIFITHALDHMTSAEDMILIAKRFINLYKKER
jgi:cellobiose PTS system EIIA component